MSDSQPTAATGPGPATALRPGPTPGAVVCAESPSITVAI